MRKRYPYRGDPFHYCYLFGIILLCTYITEDPKIVSKQEIELLHRPRYYNQTWNFPSEFLFSQHEIRSKSLTIPYFQNHIYEDEDFQKTFNLSTKWDLIESVWDINSTYFEVKDTYVNGYGAFVCGNTWCREPIYTHFTITKGFLEGHVPEAIYFCNTYMDMFAHLFMDLFAPFLMLDAEIRARAPLIVCASHEVVLDIYKTLGYDPKKAIILKDRENWIHVDRCHTIIGMHQVNCHFGMPYLNLYNILHKNLALDQSPPKLYVLYNRPVKHFRHIDNFDMFVEKVHKALPQYDWLKWENITTNFIEAAKLWNAVKLVFMPTGSNVANVIFMQQNTVMCIQLFDWYDSPAIFACHSVNLTVFLSVSKTCNHFFKQKNAQCRVNTNSAIETIKNGINFLEGRPINARFKVLKKYTESRK